MAKISGLGQKLYVGGRDLSGDAGAIDSAGSPTNLLDVTSIDRLALERIYGLRDGQISFTTFFNDATDAEHDALKGLPTADVLTLWLMSGTRGDACAALSAKQINYDLARTADGGLTFKVDMQSAAASFLEYGVILVAKTTTHTSNGSDETGFDNGSAASDGAVGFLQHFADTSPSGTIEYDIEDSSDTTDGDDGSWGNLIAFTDVSTPWAAFAERKVVNGEVLRWQRASTNGTYTNASFSMSLRVRVSGDVDAA